MHPLQPPAADGATISMGMRAKSDRGYVIGVARLGYLPSLTSSSLGVEYVPDPDGAPLLGEAFLMAASGWSVRQITTWLAGQEVKGNRGGPVSPATVHRLLTDPFYAGFVRDRAGCLSAGRHQAITDGRTFALVQRRLMSRSCSPVKSNETP